MGIVDPGVMINVPLEKMRHMSTFVTIMQGIMNLCARGEEHMDLAVIVPMELPENDTHAACAIDIHATQETLNAIT
jgi:hypothetical protein